MERLAQSLEPSSALHVVDAAVAVVGLHWMEHFVSEQIELRIVA